MSFRPGSWYTVLNSSRQPKREVYNAMPFIPVPHTAMAVVEWGSETIQWTNTLYFTKTDFDEDDQTELANAVHNAMGGDLMTFLNAAWDLRQVTTYDLRTVDGPVVIDTEDPVDGTQADTPGPISVGPVVTIYTAARGRSARGRNYLTGFSETDMNETSIVDAALITEVEATYLDVGLLAAAAGWTWVVVQRAFEKAPLQEGVTREVTHWSVRNAFFGIQRRRTDRP